MESIAVIENKIERMIHEKGGTMAGKAIKETFEGIFNEKNGCRNRQNQKVKQVIVCTAIENNFKQFYRTYTV